MTPLVLTQELTEEMKQELCRDENSQIFIFFSWMCCTCSFLHKLVILQQAISSAAAQNRVVLMYTGCAPKRLTQLSSQSASKGEILM